MMLEIKDLSIEFNGFRGPLKVLDHVNLSVDRGEIVGIVGESGSGKSVTALSILGLLDKNAKIASGSITYMNRNLLTLTKKEKQNYRGEKIGMVFQEPMTALHPTMKIGKQLAAVIRRHRHVKKAEAKQLAIQALDDVRINNPKEVAKKYPFQLSGGMRQRVVIALAMAGPPELLLADEPTTALDVTIQYEILNLLKILNKEKSVSVIFITHDLGVVSQLCHRTFVMYAGQIVESGRTRDLMDHPQHPYTKALLEALPDLKHPDEPLKAIGGEVIDLRRRPEGCAFAPRCPYKMAICQVRSPDPVKMEEDHVVSCWLRRGCN